MSKLIENTREVRRDPHPNLVLPPKRFQHGEDARFDPIRGRRWYHRLYLRKWQLPLLQQAWYAWEREGMHQASACEAFGVSERELRDYIGFITGEGEPITGTEQAVIDDAYKTYCDNGGTYSFVSYLKSSAKLFGFNPRHLVERWEVTNFYYPTNYET